MDQHYAKLESRTDKGDTPYNLRNCAYIEDFFRPKIIYPDIMRMPRNSERLSEYPYFYLDNENFYVEATNFLMTGKNIDIVYSFLVSDLGFFTFSKFYTGPQFDSTGFRYKKAYLDETFIPQPNSEEVIILRDILQRLKKSGNIDHEMNAVWYKLIDLNDEEIQYINRYKKSLLTQAFDKRNLT